MYLYFSIGNGQPGEPALCQLYRHTFVPYGISGSRPLQLLQLAVVRRSTFYNGRTQDCHPSRISRDVPDLCRVVPRPSRTSPGTPNVPDFKACSLLSTGNTAVRSRGHCSWQIRSIFIAKLQMYLAPRPTNNCHQIASKCTGWHCLTVT